jgi:hypothetical protein
MSTEKPNGTTETQNPVGSSEIVGLSRAGDLNRGLLVALGLSQQSADIVMSRIEDLELALKQTTHQLQLHADALNNRDVAAQPNNRICDTGSKE